MFSISDKAKQRFTEILTQKPDSKVRLIVDSGGCAGFSYKFDLTTQINEDDLVFENLVIDQLSLDILGNFHIEYVNNLGGAYFKLDIEKATSTCGCQTSFSI
jgi:iron-sulfur cluster assembly accessory protein